MIFSTYQSIDAVYEAQQAIVKAKGRPRLYMTATPRIFANNVKARLKHSDYELCPMDDPAIYGEEIHRTSFVYAVDNGLLTDYKVLVLTVGSEWQLPESLREKAQDPDCKELDFGISSRLTGCVNGLAKNTGGKVNALWDNDPGIMRRADALMWLGAEIRNPEEGCILCNVGCLSEGIDVPALDATIFLSPRNSQIDVVQSVGRVMRNFRKGESGGKKFGYIIIPIVVNPNVSPDEALDDNAAFAVLWGVLNALRAHDERFEAIINSIALNAVRSQSATSSAIPPGPRGRNQATTTRKTSNIRPWTGA